MRILPITLLLAINLLLMASDGFSQGDPCTLYCDACALTCSAECPGGDPNGDCLDCVLSKCQGTGVPISDHAGYLLAGGLFLISFYTIRRSKMAEHKI